MALTPRLSDLQIETAVDSKQVTLSGTVESSNTRSLAEEIVASIDGIGEVINAIAINGKASEVISQPTLLQRIETG